MKSFKKMFLMAVAAVMVTLSLTGCGKSAKALPELDVNNPKSVMVYYVSCIANGEYEKAAGVAIKDGLEIVKQLKSQPDSKQGKEIIAACKQIADSVDSCLTDTSNGDHRVTYRFKVEPVKKIGVKMEGGKYWVYDL